MPSLGVFSGRALLGGSSDDLLAGPARMTRPLAVYAGLHRRHSLDRAAATTAWAFLFLLLFDRQAFCNDYWVAAGPLAARAVVEEGASAGGAREPGA